MDNRNAIKKRGWGAFTLIIQETISIGDNFADHGALLDPPTADVSARCLSFFFN